MLEGKNALVTGCKRGIGAELIKKLARSKCNIWACARSADADFEKRIQQLSEAEGVWIKPVYFDLENDDEIKAALKAVISEKKNIDILINNAGLAHLKTFEMTPIEEIKRIYQVNTFAPILISQLVMRRMSRQRSGKIINIASTAAHEVYKGNSVYGASKSALCHFTQSAAAEVAERGITINAVAPGLTATDMSAVFEGNAPELPLMRSAIGRKLDPEEIADAVMGLLSHNMRLINGQIICVNGGSK